MCRFKKYLKALSVVLFIFVAYGCQQIMGMPKNMIMLRGETHMLPAFLSVDKKTGDFKFDKSTVTPLKNGDYTLDLSLFGIVKKKASVRVMDPSEVVVGGNVVGIKLYMDGVLVIGMSEIPGSGGKSPGKTAGIMAGDYIVSANGTKLTNSDTLEKLVINNGDKAIKLEILRDGKILKKEIKPLYYKDGGAFKLGLWVRDSAAGIGTVTFLAPKNNCFAALGHGIEDPDTGVLLSLKEGSITDCDIVYIEKGEQGVPGEIRGNFCDPTYATVQKNTEIGIYGTWEKREDTTNLVLPVGVRTQVKKGGAKLYSNVSGQMEAYDVEIERVFPQKNKGSKSMVIRVTDTRLLNLTGGIVQGMSGSPLVQNGKLIGAVTHVFVNDPTRGYGIFIENMLDGAA